MGECWTEINSTGISIIKIINKMDKIVKQNAEYLTYTRHSALDDIPDNFEERMRNFKHTPNRKKDREVKIPEGFAIAPAYNKSGYQLIPKEDL